MRRRGVRASDPRHSVTATAPVASGGRARAWLGGGAPENLKFTKGEDLVKTYESELAPRNFCSNCGSSIYDDLGEDYFVAAGLMGDLDMKPLHQQVAYKASWHQIGEDAPQYDEMPPA